jgi:predicted lipoprotein with Yx(FWY)xxD motif
MVLVNRGNCKANWPLLDKTKLNSHLPRWEDQLEVYMMKQQKLNRFTLMGTFLVILSLALAACAPAAAPTSVIPVTGATGTPAPVSTTAPTAMVATAMMPTAMTTTQASSGGMMIGTKNTSALGNFLVDDKGMTLYTFKNDASGVSNCNGGCATAWPPLTAQAAPTAGTGVMGTFALIKRSDGTMQVTYNGLPLYYFSGDKAAGDTNGQGVGGVWAVAAP